MTPSLHAAPEPAQPLPGLSSIRVGFIGAGRLGKSLAWSLAQRDICIAAVSSNTRQSAESLSERIPGCVVASPQDTVDACDFVFITTLDGAIASAASQARWRPGMAAVHCSGATEVAVLSKAREDGAMIGGFHPMQTFGDPLAAVDSLPGCTITIEAQEPLDATLVALVDRLECCVNRLPPGMRGRYHAAAGYTSQFINVLFSEAAKIWQSWGATEEEAVRALLPMARGTLASIQSAGIANGMPGPVSRGDVKSIEKHVAALSALEPQVIELYRQLCGRTIPLSMERGAIDSAIAERFLRVLKLEAHHCVGSSK